MVSEVMDGSSLRSFFQKKKKKKKIKLNQNKLFNKLYTVANASSECSSSYTTKKLLTMTKYCTTVVKKLENKAESSAKCIVSFLFNLDIDIL